MFDFTSLFQAVNAARIHERNGHYLLMGLVGDSLVEPFWPTGSGCARGFLGAFDAAWMIREWSLSKKTPLEILAERESIYRLLPQTTPENLCKDYDQYGIDPKTRYPAINAKAVLPSETLQYFDTTNEKLKQELKTMEQPIEQPQYKPKSVPVVRSNRLLMWCQRVTDSYKNVKVLNLTTSFKSGLALCAIIHRFRPQLINFESLSEKNIAKNNQLAFDVAEQELGISPIMTGEEMATSKEPDRLSMVAYLSQFYDTFKDEVPVTKIEADRNTPTSPVMRTNKPRHSLLARLSYRFKKSPKSKDRENEERDEANKENKEHKKIKSPGSSKKSKKVELKDSKVNGGAGFTDQVQLRNKPEDKVDISQNRVSGLRSQLTTQFEIIAGVRR
ncbi:F-actin-monooxygenase MICAL2-like, partial [Anneissia japonica]|uniref:F-actin-monooxygenase MICAL2-like n=1 Tax=Anneissia japonica TaxID=1529436 RepID=UPI001425788F